MSPTDHHIEALIAAVLSGGLWYMLLVRLMPPVRWRWFAPLLPLLAGAACKHWLHGLMAWMGGQASAWGMPLDESAHGLVYYAANVGLREELVKLLCVAPFLPWLLRHRVVGVGLLAGAFVGLGYACEENRWFFAGHGVAPLLVGRVLSATVIHLGLTGLTTAALLTALRGRWQAWLIFLMTFLSAAIAHGVYDWAPARGPAFLHVGGTSVLSLLAVLLVVKLFLDRLPCVWGDTRPLAWLFAVGVLLLAGAALLLAWLGTHSPAAVRACATEAAWFMPVAAYVMVRLQKLK